MRTVRHISTLFYYDGPQVFEARDADGRHYVAILADSDSIGGERYLVAGIATERLQLFRSGVLDLRSLLVESDREERYVATADAGVAQPLQLEKLTEPIEDCGLLPDSGFLLHERSREATLEVNLETHDGSWHVLDLQSHEVQERTLDCDSDDDWAWLIGQIRRYESSRLR